MCEGCLNDLKNYVLQADKRGDVTFPFASAQISEITQYPITTRCRGRLKFVEKMSGCLYFVHSVYDYEFRNESPFSVYETINEALPELNENKLFSDLIPYEAIKECRSMLGLDPIMLNNLPGDEAVMAIDAALASSDIIDVNSPKSIKDMLEITKQHTKSSFSKLWADMGTTEDHMTIGSDLQGVFTLLEIFGYWPDKKGVYRKGSRFTDTQHIFNAAHCDSLVTNDKGMKNRAKATFKILDIPTSVLNTNEFQKQIQ